MPADPNAEPQKPFTTREVLFDREKDYITTNIYNRNDFKTGMHDYGTSHHRADGFYFCYSAGLEGVHRRIPEHYCDLRGRCKIMKTQVDAVTVEIVGNLLLSIAEEMGVALIKSAYSTNIKERRDISTAVFDPEGNMVCPGGTRCDAPRLPSRHNQRSVQAPGPGYQAGDMFMGNDPYNGGGTHLPDITVTQPVFVGDKLIGWVANLAHPQRRGR